MKLEDKVALVTGSGGGIGRETALLLSQHGAKLVLTDIDRKAGENTLKEINENNGKAIFLEHDISSEEDWNLVTVEAIKTFNRIDILSNNAGTFVVKPLIESTVEDFDRLSSVNYKGTFLGLKTVIPCMLKQEGGAIINNSSIAGVMGSYGVSLYGSTKAAIRSLSKHAAMEHAKDNIRINSIYPGFIDTKMLKHRSDIGESNSEEQSNKVPMKKIGTAKDIANAVLFLASDDSSYMTGAEIVIDGGRSMSVNV